MATETFKLVGFIFDVLAAIVSLLDLSTDLIILITWFYQDRMIFFYISLSILILAQISYIIIFYYNHGTWSSLSRSFVSVLCTFPFTPILSFVFYFVAAKDSKMRVFIDKLCCFHFEWSNYTNYNTQESPLQQYLDNKIYKHLGFLLEAMIEAFPQSILQLTAIVYYNEPNLISIISILISMTSVCSKIFLLVITGNLVSWKSKAFLWLSFVVDFFSIFFIVSFAFHQPTNPALLPYFTHIRNICIWETILCIMPFAGICTIGMHVYWTAKLAYEETQRTGLRIVFGFVFAFGIAFLWIIGLFVTFLMMVIFCVLWGCIAIMGMEIESRLPYEQIAKQFYVECIHWILSDAHETIDKDTNEILISKSQDRLLRICILNKFVLEQPRHDNEWLNYLDEPFIGYMHEKEKTQFHNVSYKDLRINCKHKEYKHQLHTWHNKWRHPFFTHSFYYDVYANALCEYKVKLRHNSLCYHRIAVVILYYLTWFAGPLYLLSRWWNVLLPLYIALYLNHDDINLFTDLDTFQVIMWIFYVFLLSIWFILAFVILRETFILWHILPSTGSLKGPTSIEEKNTVERKIKDYYYNVVMHPIIKKIIRRTFGGDISEIIFYYLKHIELIQATDTPAIAC